MPSTCPSCGSEVGASAKFCGECGARLAESVSPAIEVTIPKLEDMHTQLQSMIPEELAQKYLSAEQQTTGENRPITALFADISGFTPLSNSQSSETIFQLVQDCFKQLVGVVARYEGSISGFRGDGLLALFGAPILHENDAERAILAAVDMRSAIQEHDLQVSIGINTAMMTVGEIQTQLHMEYTAYGTDINLAKRLQEAAEPSQILVGTGTYRLTRRMFDFEALAEFRVKGFSQQVTAYAVQQAKARPEKLRGIEGLRARMIGREHEFADLKEAADACLDGQGRMVSIIGEAGIGKSRLVSELRQYLNSKGAKETGGQGDEEPISSAILEGRCVSVGQPISYWPFLDILRAYLGLGEEDDETTRAHRLTESITQLMPQGVDETLPLLGNLLSVKFGNELDDRLKFASPEQIRHQTLMRLRDLFESLARQQPLLLILEDLHWADDLSLDLISLLMDELVNAPLMLLCVYRPERDHRVWQLGNQARRKCLDRYTELTLNPLSGHQSRLLVESLLEIDNLPESTKDVILTKSEGNPFFIEEIIRSLIEADVVYHEDNRWKARDEIANIHVPDTIQSVVLARVDRLEEEAKYVLRCASVIGRLFRYRLLHHISQQEHDLDRYLSDFEAKELVYEERTVPELEYAFKHAFTQEATYEGILEQRRREFHHQVAQQIERLYQERLEEYYEELAHHYSRSENAEKTVEYLLKAGEKAGRNYSNQVAISHFKQALETLEQSEIERNDWRLEALRGLGEVYLRIGDNAKSTSVFEEAVALGEKVELTPRQLARLYYGLGESLYWQGRFDEVLHSGKIGLEILGDDMECVEAALMNSIFVMGAGDARAGAELFKEYTHRSMTFIKDLPYTVELRASYIIIVSQLLWDREPESAWEWAEELETCARKHNDLKGLLGAWLAKAWVVASKGDYEDALLLYQKSIDMAERIGDMNNMTRQSGYISFTLLGLGRIAEAEAHMQKMLEADKLYRPGRHLLQGNIAMIQHRWEESLIHYQNFLEERQNMGRPIPVAQQHLQFGQVHLKKGDYHQAVQSFQEAANAAIEAQEEQVLLLSGAYISTILLLPGILAQMEEAYVALGAPEKFVEYCHFLEEQHADALRERQFFLGYLEPAGPSAEFSNLSLEDDFNSEVVDSSWNWIDEFSDCAYQLTGGNGLVIFAPNGRTLDYVNLSAPRLVQETASNLAVEVCILPASDDKPQIGGLLVWKDRDNFLRFEKGMNGQKSVLLGGYTNGERQIAGHGLMPGDGETHLRLERLGDQFSAYCSADGENWLTCGTMTLPLDDPIQVGIYANGMIDRTIYCGSYEEGTATQFRSFKLWTRQGLG